MYLVLQLLDVPGWGDVEGFPLIRGEGEGDGGGAVRGVLAEEGGFDLDVK